MSLSEVFSQFVLRITLYPSILKGSANFLKHSRLLVSVIFFETPIPELSKTTTEYLPEILMHVVATALFSLYASFSI